MTLDLAQLSAAIDRVALAGDIEIRISDLESCL